jgi:hypothetical protein
MNITQIEEKVKALVTAFDPDTFIYDLLEAYGKPKASISRLRVKGSGSYNLSKEDDDSILWKKQLMFKTIKGNKLHSVIDELHKSDLSTKHSPRFIIVTNYDDLLAIDTKTSDTFDGKIADIPQKFDFFLPWSGMEKTQDYVENVADVKAAEKMAKLFDQLREDNDVSEHVSAHALNVFLARLLFCLFAEDTDIFPKDIFTQSIEAHTHVDGSDLADYLHKLFSVMDQEDRTGLPSYLTAFPYVNGGLFADHYPVPTFSRKSRQVLIECGAGLNWSEINPDIFGSMFQAVIHPEKRGNLGMHYTSVPNIMKIIEPLFLMELRAEFESSMGHAAKLSELLLRLEHLRIFDPACGSGNFLIIAYKEIRNLEMQIFQRIQELSTEKFLPFSRIKLPQFYGIELDDFAHEIAILSLWLAEHQMNVKFKSTFGDCAPSLPLKQGGSIVCGNAVHVDWQDLLSDLKPNDEVYLIGNPPYISYSDRDSAQKEEMDLVFAEVGKVMRLDYIACWFKKATDFINGRPKMKYAFLSTNSICQGEQVGLLWPYIFGKNQEIFFSYPSFKWSNNAKANAGVTCIIAGVQNTQKNVKLIFNDGMIRAVKKINPYLVEGEPIVINQRTEPVSNFAEMALGSSAIDGGNLLLSPTEKNNFIAEDPRAAEFIKQYIGGEDFLDGKERFCLWIDDDKVDKALDIANIRARVESCKKFRETAGRDAKKGAAVPHRFFYRKYKVGLEAILLPMTSSERRTYIPIGICDHGVIPSHGVFVIYDVDLTLFGILSSRMHMAWTHSVSGRLESRVRYSVNLTYNNFPFPKISKERRKEISGLAQSIITIREQYSEKTLSDLYDPVHMPEDLLEAHAKLDRYIETCYQSTPFSDNEERLACLFKLYEKLNGEVNG